MDGKVSNPGSHFSKPFRIRQDARSMSRRLIMLPGCSNKTRYFFAGFEGMFMTEVQECFHFPSGHFDVKAGIQPANQYIKLMWTTGGIHLSAARKRDCYHYNHAARLTRAWEREKK